MVRLLMAAFAVFWVMAGLPLSPRVESACSPGVESASPAPPLTVTAAADPPSGSQVRAGDSITCTLTAAGHQPVPDCALVVDDLYDLVDDVTVLSSRAELADAGLALDEAAGTISWTVPTLAAPYGAGSEARTSFRVKVADAAEGLS